MPDVLLAPCDALLAPSPGQLTWAINQKTLSDGLVVSDDEVAHAVSFAWHYLKLVIEPGGAVALAAVLHHKIDVSGKTVALILSGGNVDPEDFNECLRRHPDP
jgi:threonine dehydratase